MPRPTCHRCHRPLELCLCAAVPQIENRTEVVVLQHPRERTHPFGSARMLVSALARSRLLVASRQNGRAIFEPFASSERVALLYPRPDARDLAAITDEAPLDRLVLLDGTWAQAHRLYCDNPWLSSLPHVQLRPERPSRYKVRREPRPECLSTLEAAISALGLLEGDPVRFEPLLTVFERMNDEQLERRRSTGDSPRVRHRPQRSSRSVPEALSTGRVVLLYAEAAELATRADPRRPEVLQWVATRMGTGDVEEAFFRPSRGDPSPAYLARLGLEGDDVEYHASQDGALAWLQQILQPEDVIAVWNGSTLKLLPDELRRRHDAIQVKAAYCNLRGGRCGDPADVLAQEALQTPPPAGAGRAGQRLAEAHAIATWLAKQPK